MKPGLTLALPLIGLLAVAAAGTPERWVPGWAAPPIGYEPKIKEALGRIDDGSYGKCEECGENIGRARLEARPVTTLCIDCKSMQEVQERKLKGL